MRTSVLLSTLAVPTALAFPWMTPEGFEALINHPEAQAEIRRRLDSRDVKVPRQANTGAVNGIITLLGGTVKATLDPILGLIPIGDSVKGLKKFPEGTIFPSPSSTPSTYISQPTTPFKHPAQPTNVAHALA
jgi:hypothetical protein